MKKKEKLSTEEKEMVDEIESYMEEVDSEPDVAESPLPPELQAKIHQQIETRALAREKAEREQEAEQGEKAFHAHGEKVIKSPSGAVIG